MNMNDRISADLKDAGAWLALSCPRWLVLVGLAVGLVLGLLA